jgi:nitrogen fixation protein FixH
MDAPLPSRQGTFWAFVPAGLLVSLIGFQLWLVRGAFTDASVAVEQNYYAKAVSWDDKMAQDRENIRLGWRAPIDLELSGGAECGVRVRLLGTDGQSIRGARVAIEAFHVARSGNVIRAALSEDPAGEYRAALPMPRPGLWEIRVEALHGQDRFTATTRQDVRLEALPP